MNYIKNYNTLWPCLTLLIIFNININSNDISVKNVVKQITNTSSLTKIKSELKKLIRLHIPGENRKHSLKRRMKEIQRNQRKLITKNNPLVSFIIPCYNRAHSINDVITSIYDQKLTIPFEIIVVDDHSSDNSIEILKKYEKQYQNFFVYQNAKNLKAPETRNIAIMHAKGKYIFNADSDDVFLPNTLRHMIDFCIKQDIDLCLFEKLCFFSDSINNPNRKIVGNQTRTEEKLNIDTLLTNNDISIAAGNRMFKKSVWLNVGGYINNLGHDSWSFSASIMLRGYNVRICPNSSYLHRHWTNSSGMYATDRKNQVNDISPKIVIGEYLSIFNESFQAELRNFNLGDGQFIPFLRSSKPKLNIYAYDIIKSYVYEDKKLFKEALTILTNLINKGLNDNTLLWRAIKLSLKIKDIQSLKNFLKLII